MTEKLIDGEISVETRTAQTNIAAVNASLNATADASRRAHEKANELFQRGIGGGEAAEKIKKINEGLEIFREKSINAGDRATALVGVVGMIGRMALGAGEQIVRFATDIVQATARVDAYRRTLDTLGTSYEATRRATGDAMTATDQFAVRESLLAQNIFLTDRQTGTLNERMREFALIHGGTAADAARTFEQAVLSADNNALARFGIRIDSSIPQMRRMEEALRQLSNQTREVVPQTATERSEAFSTAVGRAKDAVLAFLNPLSMEWQAQDENSRAIANVNRLLAEQEQRTLAQANALRDEINAHNELARAEQEAEAQREQRQQDPGIHFRRIRPTTSAGGQRDDGVREGLRIMYEERAAQIQALRDHNEFLSARYDADTADIQRHRELLENWHKEQREMAREAQRDEERQVSEAAQLQIQQNDMGMQLQEQLAQFSQASLTNAQAASQGIGMIASSAQASLKSHMAALIEGHENIGQALRGIVHEVGLNLAVEAGSKAIFAGLEGAFRLARSYGADPTGYALLTNAAMFAAFAVGGGVAAALTNPPAVSGVPSGAGGGAGYHSTASAAGSPTRTPEGGGTTIVYNVNGFAMHTTEVQDHLAGVLQAHAERGLRIRGFQYAGG